MFQKLAPLAVLLALAGCSEEVVAPPVSTAKTQQAVFTNGGFEADLIGAVPTGWAREKYLNNKVTPLAGGATTNNLGLLVVPPESAADLNLTPDAGGFNVNVVGALTPESQIDPQLGMTASLRYPKFGLRSAVVNPGNANQGPTDALPTGRNNSAAAMRQRTTLSAGDVDSLDGKVHLRFVAAPVLENPGHTNFEQPYFYIEVRNVTRNTILYSNFNFAGQPGVAWKNGVNSIQYTDWQLIDVAPGEDAVIGEEVELVVYAAGCSRGGHWGRVYVDAFGSTIPGLYVSGTAPAQSPNNTTLTYTLNYRNGSTAAVANTSVTFNTPPNTTFASTTGSSCTVPAAGAAGAVVCPAGTLAPDGSGSFTVTVNVPSTFTGTLTAQNYWVQGTNVNPLIGSKIDTLIFAGPATLTVVSGTPQSTTVGTAFAADLVVRVRDGNNAVMRNVLVTFAAPASGANATLPRTMVRTDANGLATLRPSANTITGTYDVTATATNTVGSGIFTLTNIAGAPASVTVVSGSTQSATRLTAFAAPLIVEVRDTYGNLVPGATVTFTAPGLGASAGLSVAAVTDATGRTQVIATATGTAGAYTVAATITGVTTSADFALTNTPGPATSLTVVSGAGQSATVNTAFAAALVVVVRDAGGNAVPGVTVGFAAPATGASAVLSGATATTAANGEASITATANTIAGTYAITASSAGLTAVTLALTNTAGAPATITTVSGSPQSTTVLTGLAAPLVVVVRDAFGNPVPGVTVTFSRPVSGASNTGATTAVTGVNGEASISPTANGVAGAYVETASVTGVTSPASFALTNTAGPATTLTVISGTPQSTAVTTAFAAPLVVRVTDAQGNVVSGATVSFSAPGTGASAVVATSVTTAVNGEASTSATANGTAGTYAVTASLSGGTSPVTFTFTNTAGAAASISVVSGSNQSTVVLTAFTAPLIAVVRDANNNPLTGVTVSFTAPVTGATATVTSTAITNAQGQVSVPATANGTSGAYQVNATVTGVTMPAAFLLTNTAGPAASVTVESGSNQTAAVGTAFADPLVVVVKDAQGNPIANSTVTFTVPATGASATLTVTVTTDANGRASTPVTANAIVGPYAVTATVTGVTNPASFALTNVASAPASIALDSGGGQSAPVVTAYAQPLVFVVRDSNMNAVADVRVDLSTPATGASVTLSSTSQRTDAQGKVSVTATANTVAGAVEVSAVVSGVTNAAVAALTNTPGAAVSVRVVSGGTQSTATGSAFPSPLLVEAIDAYGNVVPDTVLTWSVPSSGPGASLSATSTTTDANGRASITATANTAAGSYPVTVRLPGGQQADFVLTNTASGSVSITVSSGTPQSTVVATAFGQPLVARVQQNGNPVANAVVTFQTPLTGASATLSAITAQTDAQGLATVSATANTRAGTFEVTATTPGGAQPATFALTTTAGPAAALVPADGSTPQSAQTGTDFGAPLTLTVVDQYGNPVSGAMVTFTTPATGPGATLSSNTVTSDADGHVTVTAIANGAPGTYQVTATTAGVTTPAQFDLTNLTVRPYLLTVVEGTPQQTVVDTAFPAPLRLRVTQDGVPVVGTLVTFTPPASMASATLSAPSLATDAQGEVRITATASRIAGRYTVLASVPSGSTPARFALANTPAAPASVQVLSSASPQSTAVLTPFALPLAVTVLDAFSNAVPGATVAFASPGTEPTATLTATSPVTDGNGQASVAAIAGAQPGSYVVTATVTGVTMPGVFRLTNLAVGPSVIAVEQGSAQSTLATTAFPMPIRLTVRDAAGQPIQGALVTVTLPSTGSSATVPANAVLTSDASGTVQLTLTANAVPGTFVASFAVPGVATAATARLTVTAIPTTTTVAVNPAAPRFGGPVELVSTVTSDHGTPTGTVRFEVDGAAAGTATLSNGKATLGGVQLTAGNHDVTAVYDAQGAFDASSSAVDGFEVLNDQGSLNGGGGCACSSGEGAGGVQWLLALLGVVFLSSRRRLRHGARAVAAVAVVTSTLVSAQAASGVSLNIFHPAPAGSDWFGGDSLDLRGTARPSARLLFDYGHNPLVVYNSDGSVRSVAIANQAFLNAQVSLVAANRIRIGLTLPIALHSGSFNASFNGQSLQPANQAGLGDLGFTADVRLVGTYGSPFTLAIGALLGLPTGDPRSFFGDGKITVTPRLAAAGEISRFAYTAHVAYAFREGNLAGVPVNNELQYGVTAGLLFFDRKFLIGPELHGLSDFTSGNVGRATALEIDLGAHVQFHPDWRMSVGGGTGLTRAVGVPDYRLLASLQWQPHYQAPRTDRDGDGVYDDEDECPQTPMGVHPDLSRTGCPLIDSDHDGVFDGDDLCPTVPSGSAPDLKRAGCPDPDTDGDGILDSVDLCPTVHQGQSPDPAKRGCPDLDTDGDGVTDSVDQCKTEPMGTRPDRSKRGCPLRDRDDDGIVDANDACPDKPGSPNTNPKKNGCPGLVKLEGSKILILTPVNFASGKDVILPSSNSVLTAVAETLKTFPEIEQLSIEGHTDSKGKPANNKGLSQRRANSVQRWLIAHDIDPSRLEAHGFGQEQPIDDNKTQAGRAKNRRVEFKITRRAGE